MKMAVLIVCVYVCVHVCVDLACWNIRFPGRGNEPNYANEYSIGAFGYGGGNAHQQQQQQHQQHQQQQHLQTQAQAKDRELKFDFQPQQEQFHHHPQPPTAAAPQQQYSYGYGYGHYANYQQQQQQQAMSHVSLAHQQQQQHQGFGAADPLGMLVSSATQPTAMPPPPQQQQHDVNKSATVNKYRGAASFAVTPSQEAYLGGPQALFANHAERQQDSFLPLKYGQNLAQQQQQQMPMDVANPHQTSFRAYGGAAGGSYYGSRGQTTSMELVSPTAAAAAMTSSYDASASALQRMGNSNSNNSYPLGLRVPHLLPGSAAALTNRLKDAGDLDPRIPASVGFDQQSAVSKGLGSSHQPIYAESSTSAGLSDAGATANSNNVLYSTMNAPGSLNAQVPNASVGGSEEVCSLCLGSQCDRIASACGHRFHSACLQDWGEKLACPMCRPVSTTVRSFFLHISRDIAFRVVCSHVTLTPSSMSCAFFDL